MPNVTIVEEEVNHRKVRLGLAFLTLVVIGALVGAFTVKNATGQLVLLGIAGFTIIRTFIIGRSIAKDRRSS